MYREPAWPSVNKSEETNVINFQALFQQFIYPRESPIDEYYSHARALVLSTSREEIALDAMMMRLLVLELISTAELYFRRVLAEIINICPESASVSAKRPLLFGATSYYTKRHKGYALLEGISLSGNGEVKKQTLNITGFDIKPPSSLTTALNDFEKICQLRHVIVHCKGEAGAKNIMELGLSIKKHSKLSLDPISFQSLVLSTHNAVRAYNTALFKHTLGMWHSKGYLKMRWDDDKKLFEPLFNLFYSKNDGGFVRCKTVYETFKSSLT